MDNLEERKAIVELNEYAITIEEMIGVRGGDGSDPIYIPNPPKTKI